MSIPGLGILPSAPPKPTSWTIDLPPLSEYRILIHRQAIKPLSVTLVSGTAERDGVELATNIVYNFRGPVRTKLFTFSGCSISVEGVTRDEGVEGDVVTTGEKGEGCVVPQYLNLHVLLHRERERARRSAAGNGHMNMNVGGLAPISTTGPRVLITGAKGSGKTSLAKMLIAWATKAGSTPMIVNLDPHEGVLTLPGTLSAAVMATTMDVETRWGVTPSSGPSATPVKLPLVQYFGRSSVKEAEELWRGVVGRLVRSVSARLVRDQAVRGAGVVVDSQGLVLDSAGAEGDGGGLVGADTGMSHGDGKAQGMTLSSLAHAVEELSINIIVVLAPSQTDPLVRAVEDRFRFERTSLGEQVRVVQLDVSDGATRRDAEFQQREREAAIKEYFFGDPNRTLSPFTQMVEFDSLVIWKNWADGTEAAKDEDTRSLAHSGSRSSSSPPVYTRLTNPVPELSTWCLAIMCISSSPSATGSNSTPEEEIQHASVKGFVYVADVDRERRRLKILTPVSGRLGDNPLLWGRWPEPSINLLG